MEDKKIQCERCDEFDYEDLMYPGNLCESCNSDLNDKW